MHELEDRFVLEEAAVLFADVKGFTSLTVRMGPLETFRLLDRLFAVVEPVIASHGGRIDKYIGDAVMALFGRPDQAVRAAAEMIREVRSIRLVDGSPLEMGAGIQHGPVMAGLLGHGESARRTVIGDVVNVAARMEGLTRTYGIDILGGPGLGLVAEGRGEGRFIDWTRVKGRGNPVGVYELMGADDRRADKTAAGALFGRGVACFHTGRIVEAIDAFEAYDRQVPDDPVCRVWLGRCRSPTDGCAEGIERSFSFDEAMHTDVELIDRQHQELFDQAEQLRRALLAGDTRVEAARTGRFLADNVIEHFADEEALMEQAGFPDIELQRAKHAFCNERVASLLDNLRSGEDDLYTAFRIWVFVVDWMTDHIIGEDLALGRHILGCNELERTITL